jgi:hypothetical protein
MKKREISPALNISADKFVSMMPTEYQGIISRIRAEKDSDVRLRPSMSLIDKSNILTPKKRAALIDRIASLVDENVAGRSEMCLQFAILLNLALKHLGFESYAVTGTATYLSAKGKRIFKWRHGWVRIGREVVDANTDSISENVIVPSSVNAAPYWGPLKELPARSLEQDGYIEDDPDVINIWWPELKEWLDKGFNSTE